MKESSWEECIEFNSAVSISKDKPKAKSLLDTSQARIRFLEGNKANEENVNFIFEGYYSSALEMLHALVLVHGYKVTNHICLGYYLREVLKNDALYRIFDDCRIKRNTITNVISFNIIS